MAYLCGMAGANKNLQDILLKLNIEKLNPMQEEAMAAIHSESETVLLSPTGTGKTLAFLLPIIADLDPSEGEVQAMIIVPSRELAIQIEQVAREMGTGYKINSVYGGQSFNQDRINLKHRPAIIIGTPGRVADHLRRNTFDQDRVSYLVLDEFDKSLEIGFEDEMREIIEALEGVTKKILTSATNEVDIPDFVKIEEPKVIDYLGEGVNKLALKNIISPTKDKLDTLLKAICHLGDQPGIIFCNFKDSIQRVSDFLTKNGLAHGCFYGGLEQQERERALIKFRNGTHKVIIATDLAARGLDIPEIKFIIHYHLPNRSQEFTHRNGRTARMHSEGTAYVLKWEEEELPEFIDIKETEELTEQPLPKGSEWKTLLISGGRKDKISKGDIAGWLFRQGELNHDDVGLIELKQDCSFAAIKANKVKNLIKILDNGKLKRRKVRIYEV